MRVSRASFCALVAKVVPLVSVTVSPLTVIPVTALPDPLTEGVPMISCFDHEVVPEVEPSLVVAPILSFMVWLWEEGVKVEGLPVTPDQGTEAAVPAAYSM